MKYGRVKFYADENIEASIVEYIRIKGYRVEYANELSFAQRDDHFHLHEARRRKCVLLTHDDDFLDHRLFQFNAIKDTAIIVLRTRAEGGDHLQVGYMLVNLIDEIAASGRTNLQGMKIELKGPVITCHALVNGGVRTDREDMSKPTKERVLFQDLDQHQ
jgi:predicted nuclease of predicted toxin-antitoxin system